MNPTIFNDSEKYILRSFSRIIKDNENYKKNIGSLVSNDVFNNIDTGDQMDFTDEQEQIFKVAYTIPNFLINIKKCKSHNKQLWISNIKAKQYKSLMLDDCPISLRNWKIETADNQKWLSFGCLKKHHKADDFYKFFGLSNVFYAFYVWILDFDEKNYNKVQANNMSYIPLKIKGEEPFDKEPIPEVVEFVISVIKYNNYAIFRKFMSLIDFNLNIEYHKLNEWLNYIININRVENKKLLEAIFTVCLYDRIVKPEAPPNIPLLVDIKDGTGEDTNPGPCLICFCENQEIRDAGGFSFSLPCHNTHIICNDCLKHIKKPTNKPTVFNIKCPYKCCNWNFTHVSQK